MLSHAKQVEISGGTFTNIYNEQIPVKSKGFDALRDAAAHRAFHNSGERFDPPRCHPQTRRALLNRLLRWAKREAEVDKLVVWINGSAGIGKSAIEQSMAEMCERGDDFIMASFFFSRNDNSRNDSRMFVATIVYQMAVETAAFYHEVESIIYQDPLIFNKSQEAQMDALVIRPLQRLLKRGELNSRYLLIVDGLDECTYETRVKLINVIRDLVLTFQSQSIFIVSFASRPESDIRDAFTYTPLTPYLACIFLDEDYKANDDIYSLFEETFSNIHQVRRHLPENWPGPYMLGTLVHNASGQFIYASTVCKYISSRQHNPIKRLNDILGLAPALGGASPFSHIDALYRQIFLSVPEDRQEEGWNVVCMIHMLVEHTSGIELGLLSEMLDLDLFEIHTHLETYSALFSVVEVPPELVHYGLTYYGRAVHGASKTEFTYFGLPIQISSDDSMYTTIVRPLHISLRDFLFNADRAGNLYRDPSLLHMSAAGRISHSLSRPWGTHIPSVVCYALGGGGLPRHIRLSPYCSTLLTHISAIVSQTFLSNIWDRNSTSLADKIGLTQSFILDEFFVIVSQLNIRFTDSKDMSIVMDHLHHFSDMLMMRVLREMSPIDRRLTIFRAQRYQWQKPAIDKENGLLDDHLLPLFSHYDPKPNDFFLLSELYAPHIRSFFADPLRSKEYHSLSPCDVLTMSLQCLVFLNDGDVLSSIPGFKSRTSWKGRGNFYQSWVRFLVQDDRNFGTMSKEADDILSERRLSPWNFNKIKKMDLLADHYDWAWQSTQELVYIIRAAMYILTHLLEQTPPSAKVLRLVRRPNLKRFPWSAARKEALKVIKAMESYRRRFTRYRKIKIVPATQDLQEYTALCLNNLKL